MPETTPTVAQGTVFEQAWQKPESHLFHSDKHGIMAIADIQPKMPLQVVVAPAVGTPGREAHFSQLEPREQLKIMAVALAVGAKILEHCEPGQRSMQTIEGFAVPDHPHVVCYAGQRREGANRYNDSHLGEATTKQTRELIRFTPEEAQLLEARLNQLDQVS